MTTKRKYDRKNKVHGFVVTDEMYAALNKILPAEQRGKRTVKMAGFGEFARLALSDALKKYHGIEINEIHPPIGGDRYGPKREAEKPLDTGGAT